MDQSREYIIMCRKAEEIQAKIKPFGFNTCKFEIGDIFVTNQAIAANQRYLFDGSYRKSPPIEGTVWLPRQDQLQEMIIENYKANRFSNFSMLEDFYNHERNFVIEDRSLEQAWLHFVMNRKYNKIWKDEEWQIID